MELALIIVTAILPALVAIARDVYVRRKEKAAIQAPLIRQGEVDVEILTDKPAFSVRLNRLHEALRSRRARAQRPPA